MFQVKEVRRGWLRDKAWVVATADASHARRRLGWDELGAPVLKEEVATVNRGDEFSVAVPRKSVEAGQTIGPEQIESWPGFRKLWTRVR
jgi:hypothetical protein